MRFSIIGFLAWCFAALLGAGVSAQSFSDYQVSGSVAPSYQCPEYYGGGYPADGGYVVDGGYAGPGVFEPATPIFGRYSLRDRSSMYRTYPGGLAPYMRYGSIFGFVRPGWGGNDNPYQGIDPEANNPYAGYTVTRGPRDFLMKNPPNIGP